MNLTFDLHVRVKSFLKSALQNDFTSDSETFHDPFSILDTSHFLISLAKMSLNAICC